MVLFAPTTAKSDAGETGKQAASKRAETFGGIMPDGRSTIASSPRSTIYLRMTHGLAAGLLGLSITMSVQATEKKYGPGASDSEIKIGNTMPYSGPLSIYGIIGRTEAGYFKKINDEGGINGRKITFISYDDAFDFQHGSGLEA